MNKQEAIKQAQVLEKELAELKKIIETPEITPEEKFLQFVENVEIKIDSKEFPDSIFFFNGDKFLAEYHCNFPGNIWISSRIWNVFKKEFEMKFIEVQQFMSKQIEKHFKMKAIEVKRADVAAMNWIEKHFKMKASETSNS